MKNLIGIILASQFVLLPFAFAMGKAPHRTEEEIRQEELSCENLDLRQQLPAELQAMFRRARDQKDSNLCYAYASSDLLSLELGRPVSAFYLAVQYNNNLSLIDKAWRNVEGFLGGSQRNFPEGGSMQSALRESLRKYGVCSEEILASQSASPSFKAEMRALNSVLRQGRFSEAGLGRLQSILNPYFGQNVDYAIPLRSAINEGQSAVRFLANLSREVCHGGEFQPHRYEVISSHEIFDFQEDFIRNLKEGHATGVTYFSSFTHKEDGTETFFNELVPDHVVVAMGQRFNPGNRSCELLIRDSFGAKCDHLKSSVECELNQDQPTGYFWVNRDQFIHHLGYYTYLKKSN